MQTAVDQTAHPLRRMPSPMWLAAAGFALMFAAALVLWARYGTAVFVDGAAVVWGCF